MNKEIEMTTSWMKIGGVCGILGIFSYLAAAFVPMPDMLVYAAAFAFGPLLAIGAIGLYHGLSAQKRTPLTQIATFFAVSAGITLLIMLTVQQAIFGAMKVSADKIGETANKDIHKQIFDGLDAVHFGIDVAWDVLISTAVILFGIAMLHHPKFGKIIGALGILFGSLLLAFNLWHFPLPPASVDSIDWGPAVALWLLTAFILLLRAIGWARHDFTLPNNMENNVATALAELS